MHPRSARVQIMLRGTQINYMPVQIRAIFGIEMLSSGIPFQVPIGQAKFFDISAANQNQGGKSICSPRIWSARTRVLRRAVSHLDARIDNRELTQQDGWNTQDGRMTKKCRVRLGMHSLAPHFFVILPS